MSKQTEEERQREIDRAEADRMAWGTSMLKVDNDGNVKRIAPDDIPADVWRKLDARE